MAKRTFNASYSTIINSYLTNENVQNFTAFLFENDFIITNTECNEFIKEVMVWHHNAETKCNFYETLYKKLHYHYHIEVLSLYPHFVEYATSCRINAMWKQFYPACHPNTIRVPYNEPKLNTPILLAFLTEPNIKHIVMVWMEESRKRIDFAIYLNSFIRFCKKMRHRDYFVPSRSFYFCFCEFCKTNLGRTHNALFPFPHYFYYIMKMHILLILDEYESGDGFDAKNVGNHVFADVWIIKNVCGFL